jgi:hypothetical protein
MTESISRHKIGRYGEQLVFDVLKGAKWSNGGFESSKHYDIEWEGIKIDVNTSSIKKKTGFVFSNANGYEKELVNIFVGVDNSDVFYWVKKNLDKTGFYGRIVEAIKDKQLPDEVRKLK